MIDNNDEFLTPQAAAELLKVPVSFIYERTRRNAIPLRRIGKYVRIPKGELLAWADNPALTSHPPQAADQGGHNL